MCHAALKEDTQEFSSRVCISSGPVLTCVSGRMRDLPPFLPRGFVYQYSGLELHRVAAADLELCLAHGMHEMGF